MSNQHSPKSLRLSSLILLCGLVFTEPVTGQTTYYSRQTGPWATLGTWSLTSHTVNDAPTTLPGPTDIVLIGNGHTVTINSSATAATAGTVTVNDVGGGTLTFGSGGTASNFNVSGDFTINTGGIFQSGNTGGTSHTTRIGGDLTNNGSLNLNNGTATNQILEFNGSANRTLGGNGTYSVRNLTLNTGSSGNLFVSSSLSIIGTLNFAADGLLILDGTSNVNLGSAAIISNASSSRYIQVSGSQSVGSMVTKQNSANIAQWRILFPIGTQDGGYTPLDLTTGNGAVLATNPTNGSILGVTAAYNASIQGQLRRVFRLVVTGNNANTTMTNPRLSYNESTDISAGDAELNYTTLWYLSTNNGSWAAVGGSVTTASDFFTPTLAAPQNTLRTGIYFFTIGTGSAYPNTWYTYQSGVWSDWQNWTLDPSGTTLINDLNLPPRPGDEIVILNGSTIVNDIDGQVVSSTTIEGGATLDMAATINNTLGEITGSGLLRIEGISLPSGIYTAFVAAGTGGTIEYYNTSGTLEPLQTVYNRLIFSNSTAGSTVFVTANNLTVNSDFIIVQNGGGGTVTWQINNGTANRRTINLNRNLVVSAGGRIRVSSSGVTGPHLLNMFGNISNSGSIRFFDEGDAQLSEANYTSGAVYTNALKNNAVNVTFSGVSNQTVDCNSQTDFYRFILNKGSGQQATLTVTSSAASNFRLFGPNNRNYTGAAPNFLGENNLSLVNGTLKLEGTINIPSLVVNGGGGIGGGWPIPQNAALWLKSPNVTIQATNTTDAGDNGRQIYVFGFLRVTDGTINSGYSRGILGGGSGSILIEGGIINTWQFRTTYLGSNNRFAYFQTGGTVNVGTAGLSGVNVTTYPRFALPYIECTFQMSGGTINVANPLGSGGILIFAASSNINVTGGTINAILPASATNFTISSTAPFHNLNISKTGGGASVANLNSMLFNDGADFTRPAQPLVILNDLTLITGGNPGLTCNNNDLTVGGNFTIQNNTNYTPGTNTTTFNGLGNQTWTHNGTIANLNDVIINKPSGILTLGGANTFPNITGTALGLALLSGVLNDGGKAIVATGAITNSAVHESTGGGHINVNGPVTIAGDNGVFGTLRIQTNATVSIQGKQTITGNLRLTSANSSMDIGQNNLTISGGIFSNNAETATVFNASKRIITSGLRNDGGLTRQASSGNALLFPVGTPSIAYTPATITVTATTTGLITIRPVSNTHPNVTTTSQSVQFFWRVTSSGFSGITNVLHSGYTYSNATRDASSNMYRPARFDPIIFSWSYGPTYNANGGAGLTTIPNFNTGTGWTGIGVSALDGEYTAGNLIAFGTVTVYYSRANGAWNNVNTWSTIGVGGPVAGTIPCSQCPVVIGNESGSNHTVTIDQNGRDCGSLYLASASTLDCATFTGLNFGVNTEGTGTLRIGSANFPAGDFINFLGEAGGTVEWYGNYTIPTTGPAPQNLNLRTYYNLIVNATGVSHTLPAIDLTIYNDFTKNGASTLNTNASANRIITINRNFTVQSGTFSYISTNITDIVVKGTLIVNSGAVINTPNIGANTHTLTLFGNLVNNGTMTLRAGARLVNLYFTGGTNSSFTGTNPAASTTLNFLILDKGNSQALELLMNLDGTVNPLTNGWLTILNGTMHFNHNQTYTLRTTNTFYDIPQTARLKVSAGTVNIIGDVNNVNGDLTLAGTLEVSGGDVNVNPIGNNRNINNDIEYASAGTPMIIVSSGNLYVNGAIRRPTTTLAGSLNFIQTGGTVTIGGRNCNVAPNNTRGIFEIESNPGSLFQFSGGTLNIRRSTAGASYADLYINPETSNVSSTGTIQFGMNANTPSVTGNLSLNIVPSIGNLTLLNAGGTAQTFNMRSSELSTSGTLRIEANCTMLTNALNVNIGGDLDIAGIYNGTISGGNTTIFNGNSLQNGALTSGSTFENITINKSAGTAILNGNSSINNLNILNGVLSVTNILDINGNIVNNSSQIGAGMLRIFGTSAMHTIISFGGSFTNLSLGGSAALKRVNLVGNATINGILDFTTSGTSRYFFIGSYRLTFSTSASVSNAGANRFIRTNGVASDLGVTKNWPTGTSSFTYAVGTRTNYTPVIFTGLNVSASGTFTIAPVDGQHPTADATGEQILNYYWILTRDASLAFSALTSHAYQFPAGFIGGLGGTLSAAHLDAVNLIGWTHSPANGGSINTPTNTLMTYVTPPATNLPVANGIYHYTLGTTVTLPNPITPVYSRFADADGVSNSTDVADQGAGGNWNLATNWTLSPTGNGTGLSVVPRGRPVVILPGARINMNVPGLTAFTTLLNGLLVVPTVGHNLGAISGTGTMRTTTSTLPAGTYTAFVSSAGGTIEYVAPMTMNNRGIYNNVSIIGSGDLIMTNTDLILNGNMTIGAGTDLDNSPNNRSISIAGNWINNGGDFTAGTGSVIFNSAANQGISGTTSFFSVAVTKPGGTLNLTGTGTTTIDNTLTLTDGRIVSTSAHTLTLASAALFSGGSVNSFIAGPVRKTMAAGSSTTYPLGSISKNVYRPLSLTGTSDPDVWTVSYVGQEPTLDGYDYSLMNTGNIGTVSKFEYWNIGRTGTAAASVTLTYGPGSYFGAGIGILANLRVARWNGALWDLPPGGGTYIQTGSNVAGTVQVSNVTVFSPFTFASLDVGSPLPVRWISFEGIQESKANLLKWTTALETENDYFEVQRSLNGVDFYAIGTVQGTNDVGTNSYSFRDSEISPFHKYYYRIRQVDYNGGIDYSKVIVLQASGKSSPQWTIYPNPIFKGQYLQIAEADYNPDGDREVNLVIYAPNGMIIYQESGYLNDHNSRISTLFNDMTKGMYLIRVSDDLRQEIFRLIVN